MLKVSYQEVEDVILTHASTVSAAEAQGILAGMLCLNGQINAEHWMSKLFGELRDDLDGYENEAMKELYVETRKQMEETDFSFELFLPDDDVLLNVRAGALSRWCQGFLYGVGYQGAAQSWSDESMEILHDLADISRLDTNAAGEEDEIAYTEICEFVRISVHMLRDDFQPPTPKKYIH